MSYEDDRVLTLEQWYKLNGFSRATMQRLFASGKGPRRIKLSERRWGITVAENRRWQASRTIDSDQE